MVKAGPAEPPPEPPGRGGGQAWSGPRPEHRGFFFLLEMILIRVTMQH